MFQLATCNQFVELKRKYAKLFTGHTIAVPAKFEDDHLKELQRLVHDLEGRLYEWTLKEFGSLFIYDFIAERSIRNALEFGNGYNPSFSQILKGHDTAYSCLDNPLGDKGIIGNKEKADRVTRIVEENGHEYIRGWLGGENTPVAKNSRDLIFSISVVEHIDDTKMTACAMDAFRILKPGGTMVCTIDIYPGSRKHRRWHKAAINAGFHVEKPYTEKWEFSGNNTTFIERADIRYLIYSGRKFGDPLPEDRPFNAHFATAIHVAQKPV